MSEDPKEWPDAPAEEPEAPAPSVEEPPTVATVPGPIISDGLWSTASSTWLNNHVRNSPIAQSAEAWQHLGLILPQLRGYLETELSKLGLTRPAN